MAYTTKRYVDKTGHVPYTDWINKLIKKDLRAVARIDARLDRASAGNFGDHKFERDGVWELRVDYGPGYSVYYALEKNEIILLLVGGDKSTQKTDLNLAVKYLQDYKTR